MEKDQLKDCPCGGSNACYEQNIDKDVTTWLCFGCGKSSSSVMKVGSDAVLKAIESAPELYKDVMFEDENGLKWIPTTINVPTQGMVFYNGTNPGDAKWAGVQAVEVIEEEKEKYPIKGKPGEYHTHRMDMSTMKPFEMREFIDALTYIGVLPE